MSVLVHYYALLILCLSKSDPAVLVNASSCDVVEMMTMKIQRLQTSECGAGEDYIERS